MWNIWFDWMPLYTVKFIIKKGSMGLWTFSPLTLPCSNAHTLLAWNYSPLTFHWQWLSSPLTYIKEELTYFTLGTRQVTQQFYLSSTFITTFKILNDLAPYNLSSLLAKYQPAYLLRSSNGLLLQVPPVNTVTYGYHSFLYYVPKVWNSLPNCINVWSNVWKLFFLEINYCT